MSRWVVLHGCKNVHYYMRNKPEREHPPDLFLKSELANGPQYREVKDVDYRKVNMDNR
jgi:hypothetical protein